MKRTRVRIGRRYVGNMPWSEAAISLRIADKLMAFELVDETAAQLYDLEGSQCSFPVAPGEVGIYRDHRGHWHPEALELEPIEERLSRLEAEGKIVRFDDAPRRWRAREEVANVG